MRRQAGGARVATTAGRYGSAARCILAVSCGAGLLAQRDVRTDPFDLFRPQVAVSPQERAKLEGGAPIVKTLAVESGEVAVFSSARIGIDAARLAAWIRRIDALKKGKYVPAIGRFSRPPRVADLAALELEPRELDELRNCRVGECGLKLNEAEVMQLSALAKGRSADWRAATQQAYREALVRRAEQYLAGGLAGASPYVDSSKPVALETEFATLFSRSGFLSRVPAVANFVRRFPAESADGLESFLYWSKELMGGRPIVTITHVTMAHTDDHATAGLVVLSKQVYASHYMTGSLAVTTLVGDIQGAPRYLAYLNRSRVDVLDGFFAGLVRRVVERRLREEAGIVVDGLRVRLESGAPPP